MQFDFYVQATSYMNGFAAHKDSMLAEILSTASKSANTLTDSKSKSYYRFDVKNYDTNNGFEPYRITESVYLSDASKLRRDTTGFYSVEWYFEQPGRGAELYKEYYEDIVDKNPERIYDETGYYLFETLKYIKEDSVSVIFTDLVDSKFETDKAIDWLTDYLSKDTNNAVGVLARKIPFDGPVYTVIGEHYYENHYNSDDDAGGGRPFYILVLGGVYNVEQYFDELKMSLSNAGIDCESIVFNGKKSDAPPVMNYVNGNDLPSEAVEAVINVGTWNSRPLRMLSEQQSVLLQATERDVLDFSDSLCLEINPNMKVENTVELPLNLPLRGFKFWGGDYITRNLSIEISADVSVKAGGDEYEWLNVEEPEKIAEGSTAIVSEENDSIKLNLLLNKSELREAAPSNSGCRFKVAARIKNNVAYIKPEWINQYLYDGVYSNIESDNLELFGSYTQAAVSDLFDRLIRAAENADTQNNTIANLLLYLIY
ncbi:MAG: hypothetical protein LBQ68_06255 [Clostridiales bacterium]|nr:hypothetical protein [Clostridiales bacterium]